MEMNPEEDAQQSNGDICRGCKKEIETNAKRCHHCGEYQNPWRNVLNVLVSISSLGVLLLLIGQLIILNKQTKITKDQVGVAKEQVKETRTKRIEADKVLDEARAILLTANEASEKADSVLATANTKVEKLRQRVEKADKSLNTFTEKQKKLSKDVKNLKTELTTEIKKLKERNEIVTLADAAIALSKAASYEELMRRFRKLKENDELYNIALSSILRIKDHYLFSSRVGQIDLILVKSDGTKIKNDKLTTENLINALQGDQKWPWRAKAAILLRSRKEKGVPEILIKYMGDESLDVRRECIRAFGILTGYYNVDVLDYDKSIEWWKEHKEEWESKLPK